MVCACAGHVIEHAPAVPTPAVTYAHLGIPSANGQPDLTSVEIKLERTSCYGWCPVYSLTLSGDGTGTYSGRKYVASIGEVSFVVSSDDLCWLLQLFDDVDFFSIDHGPHNIKDIGSEVITLTIGARTRQFVNRWSRSSTDAGDAQFHQGISDLASAIDNVANVEQWIGGEGERAARFAEHWRSVRR